MPCADDATRDVCAGNYVQGAMCAEMSTYPSVREMSGREMTAWYVRVDTPQGYEKKSMVFPRESMDFQRKSMDFLKENHEFPGGGPPFDWGGALNPETWEPPLPSDWGGGVGGFES